MMEKALKVALVYILIMFVVMGFAIKAKGEEYAMMTVVVEVNRQDDEVVCVDFNGNEWAFEGCEDWLVGDVCVMTMDDMDTDSIYDDEITDIRYDGWMQGWIERVCE